MERSEESKKKDYMDKDVAAYLISEFERQIGWIKLEEGHRKSLVKVLETTPMLESECFYEEPSNNQKYTEVQTFKGDPGRTSYLRITRLIRNKNASVSTEGLIKKIQQNFIRKFQFHSSTVQLRHLRRQEEIVKMMLERAKTGEKLDQLSVLFRYEQDDIEGVYHNTQFVQIDKPLIIIPRASEEEMKIIQDYEANEGQVHVTWGSARHEKCAIMSYAEYIERLRNLGPKQ